MILTLFLLLAMTVIERLRPARREPGDTERNLMLWAFNTVLGALFVSTATEAVVSYAVLRDVPHLDLNALPFWAAAALYVVAADLAVYLGHRLQHAVPWLWRMHALHHSDRCMTATTANRHHWGTALVTLVVSTPITAILLRPQAAHIAVYSVASLWVIVCHSNVDLHLGPLNRILNSPNLHRVHHSREAEHFDRNYANIFSVWDWLTGAYLDPPAEAPATGLDHAPRTIGEALLWPFVPDSKRAQGAAGESST